MNLQRCEWYDCELKAIVFDSDGSVAREIRYRNAEEYNSCKSLYFEMRKVEDLKC
jgi:hypothetical protein